MSIKLMSAVFEGRFDWGRAAPTEPVVKLVLLALADHASDSGEAVYPSIAHVCAKTGLDRSSVKRVIDAARKRGILTAIGRRRQVIEYRMTLSLGSQGARVSETLVSGSLRPMTRVSETPVTINNHQGITIAPTGARTPPEEKAETESTVQGEGVQGAEPPDRVEAPARQRPDPLDTFAAWQQMAAKPAQPQHIIAAKYRRHDLVPLCESFESATGMQMQTQPAGMQKRWLRDLGEWAAVGITPDQVREAYALTRPDKRGKGGYSVSAPGSLNSAIAQVRATPAKPAQPDYSKWELKPEW